MGNDLLGIFGSFFWFSTMIPLWIFLLYKLVLNQRTVEETFGENGKLLKRVKSPIAWTYYNKGNGQDEGSIVVSWMVMLAIFMIIICIAGFFMAFG
jgi:hypothetical protein